MTNSIWDERYKQDGESTRPPASFLVEQLKVLPRGKALDIATGSGRNALFLAGNGYQVEAVDSSEVAIEQLKTRAQLDNLPIAATCADFSDYRILERTYAVILNFYFLERRLFTPIQNGLIPGGMLLFETYTAEQARYGRPCNPAFLLRPNELLHSFSDLHIIYYHERLEHSGPETKAIASLLAQKRR